jgi:hypothetical protein
MTAHLHLLTRPVLNDGIVKVSGPDTAEGITVLLAEAGVPALLTDPELTAVLAGQRETGIAARPGGWAAVTTCHGDCPARCSETATAAETTYRYITTHLN